MLSRFVTRTKTQIIKQSRRSVVQSQEFLKHKDKLTVDSKKVRYELFVFFLFLPKKRKSFFHENNLT